MAKAWFSLRPHQIIKKAKEKGFKDFGDIYFGTAIRGMPEPVAMIGDLNWDGKGNFLIKVNEANFNWITTSKLSPYYGKESKTTGPGGKERTYELAAGKIVNGQAIPLKVRFRKSGKLTKTTAGTQEQELGSAFIFRRALNENAGWNSWQEIVTDDKTYPKLVDIFKGSVPETWLISYFAQSQVLLNEVKPPKMSEFNRDGGFMKFITDLIKKKFGISQKDTWNPADIWIINGNQNSIEQTIKNKVEGKHQTIRQLNGVLRGMFNSNPPEVMGISLKKTGPTAYYEKLNMSGIIPDTKEYNFNVPMKDFESYFKIEGDMFTQDVKISVDAKAENKTFTFQIKANDSGATNGSNLKFEPTAKGSGLARLGKAPVEEVAEILKEVEKSATFINKYQDYPKDETSFKTHRKKGETYFRDSVLPALLNGKNKITTDITDIDQVIKNIKQSFNGKKDRGTNTRCKLMGLDFFYQVSKLSDLQRNEFITDMVFLAQKKAFGKRADFGPFGKIY